MLSFNNLFLESGGPPPQQPQMMPQGYPPMGYYPQAVPQPSKWDKIKAGLGSLKTIAPLAALTAGSLAMFAPQVVGGVADWLQNPESSANWVKNNIFKSDGTWVDPEKPIDSEGHFYKSWSDRHQSDFEPWRKFGGTAMFLGGLGFMPQRLMMLQKQAKNSYNQNLMQQQQAHMMQQYAMPQQPMPQQMQPPMVQQPPQQQRR